MLSNCDQNSPTYGIIPTPAFITQAYNPKFSFKTDSKINFKTGFQHWGSLSHLKFNKNKIK